MGQRLAPYPEKDGREWYLEAAHTLGTFGQICSQLPELVFARAEQRVSTIYSTETPEICNTSAKTPSFGLLGLTMQIR